MIGNIRFKCPKCGNVVDLPGNGICSSCSTPLNKDGGLVYIYRMGSPLGIAVGFGIYIDNQPYGHLGNQETIAIALPYGTHTIHVTHGSNRKCTDLTVNLNDDCREVFVKGHIQMGFWTNTIILQFCGPNDFPH